VARAESQHELAFAGVPNEKTIPAPMISAEASVAKMADFFIIDLIRCKGFSDKKLVIGLFREKRR
jgi:hypothetical protein